MIGVLFSYYKTNEKRNKWALTTQLKYDWSLNKFDLPLSSLFSRIRNRISSREKQIIIWFMAFRLNFTYTVWVFCFYFPSFSQMSAVIVQERKLLLYLVSFCPSKSINSFYVQYIFNFLASVRHFVGDIKRNGRNNIISCILISFTHQVEVFSLIVLSIVALFFIRL